MKLRFQLRALAMLFAGVLPTCAQTLFVWSPTPTSGVFELGANWTGSAAPTAGAAHRFGPTTIGTISLNSSPSVASIAFDGGGSSLNYIFSGTGSPVFSVGSGGISISNTTSGWAEFGATVGVGLTANQTWNTGANSTLKVAGSITGAFSLTKTGVGGLQLAGANLFSGGLTIKEGYVEVLPGGTLGGSTANLTLHASGSASWTSLSIGSTAQSIGALTFGGTGGTVDASNALSMNSDGRLTLGGNVTSDASSAPSLAYISGGTLVLGGNRQFQVMDSPNAWSDLYISARIEGTGALTKTGSGALELGGNNTYTGGTVVNDGILRASETGALPAGGSVVLNAVGGPVTLDVNGTQSIGSLTFGGATAVANARHQVTMAPGATLTLGGTLNYIATNGPAGAFIEGGTLNLGSSTRLFDIGNSLNANVDVTVHSLISGTAGLTKSGTGTLLLTGNNTFSGGVTVNAGTLLVGGPSAGTTGLIVSRGAGLGTLTLSSGATLAAQPGIDADMLELTNPVSLSSGAILGSSRDSSALLKLTGPVTVTAAAASTTSTVQLAPDAGIFFTGSLGAATAGTGLTFRSDTGPIATAVLAGTTNATITNLTADHAGILFGHANAVPSAPIIASANNGYIGVIAMDAGSVPSPATVLSRISNRAGFSGTFGLDTFFETMGAYRFTDALDLQGFGAGFTLGSLSAAIVSGAIIPPATGYAFGNGGGVLVVSSNLNDFNGSKSVSVNSTTAAERGGLLAVFEGNNTFSGAFSVTNSGATLNSATALPALRTITLGANAYAGYTEAFTGASDFAAFAARISSYTGSSVIGLDSRDWIASALTVGPTSHVTRYVSQTVDLTNLGNIFLGTATRATLAGPILAPNQLGANRTLSLAAVGPGRLEVQSALLPGNVNQVVVGTPSTAVGHGTVVLSGQSTYAGGTTLQSGTLLLEGSSWRSSGGTIISGPLGTGPLTVPNSGQFPILGSTGWAHIDNPISLGGPLQLGGHDDSDYYNYDWVKLNGVISNLAGQAGTLHIRGGAELTGANTFSGGVFLERGAVTIGHNSALGTGDFTVNPTSFDSFGYAYVGISVGDTARTINNRVILNSSGEGYLGIYGNGSLTISGPVVLNGNVRLAPDPYPLFLNGPISGSAPLLPGWGQPVVVNSTSNTYTGGTLADYGAVIFGSGSSIPASNQLTAMYGGYIGVGSPTFTTSLQANFLDRFNKLATNGTIGFDSLTTGTTNTFASAIDLRGFSPNARLGTTTRAILTGQITPQSDSYNFGGGGGLLDVNTALADAASSSRRVSVNSDYNVPLTVRLNGVNSYTGGTIADTSAIIFKASTLPATGSLLARYGGYIGTEDTSLSPASFIGRFQNTMQGGIIGFDSPISTPVAVTGALSLSRFDSATDPRIFLGSSTAATLSGAITLPAAQTAYRFAGYKGGQVTVNSVLDGTRSVEIGDANTPATFSSPTEEAGPLSTVTLGGLNTYAGGTKLFGGALGIGSNSALGAGTGTLTIEGMPYYFNQPWHPALFASGGDRTVPNPVRLNSEVEIRGANTLTLTGTISADLSEEHRIFKYGSGGLALSGNNTFNGGIWVDEGSVSFGSLNAAGTGMLLLAGTTATSASILENAVVHGLSGWNDLSLVNIAAGKTLTINQTSDSSYSGKFTFGSGASLLYTGPSALDRRVLWLYGSSSYAGTTRIGSGIIVVGAVNNAFGASTSTVQLEGGTLALGSGVTLSNPLTLTAGALAGTGTIQSAATLHIKDQVSVAPGGVHGTGTLTFQSSGTLVGDLLSLESGGMYRWQVGDATNPSGGSDRIVVAGTVGITATTLAPFTFKISPAASLDLMGPPMIFDPLQSYSWTVLSATSITGFDAGKFRINTTEMVGLMGVGMFSLSVDTTARNLLLNFTPVPEPSTYVLFGLGAVVLLLAHRRRRG